MCHTLPCSFVDDFENGELPSGTATHGVCLFRDLPPRPKELVEAARIDGADMFASR